MSTNDVSKRLKYGKHETTRKIHQKVQLNCIFLITLLSLPIAIRDRNKYINTFGTLSHHYLLRYKTKHIKTYNNRTVPIRRRSRTNYTVLVGYASSAVCRLLVRRESVLSRWLPLSDTGVLFSLAFFAV